MESSGMVRRLVQWKLCQSPSQAAACKAEGRTARKGQGRTMAALALRPKNLAPLCFPVGLCPAKSSYKLAQPWPQASPGQVSPLQGQSCLAAHPAL